MKVPLVCFAPLVALCGSAGSATAAVSYVVTDIGTLGGWYSEAYAINNNGQVVGASEPAAGGIHPFLYTGTGPMQDLGTLAGADTSADYYYAVAINSSRQVVGATYPTRHPFLYDGTGPIRDIGSLAGNATLASDINDAGQVVGSSVPALGTGYHAFLYGGNGPMLDLGTLGGSYSGASAINNNGQVVGIATTRNGACRAFLYSNNGPVQDLGTLLGGDWSSASSINDSGQIVGMATASLGIYHAFLYSGSGPMQDLGALGQQTQPTCINNSGQVVGYVVPAGGSQFPFFWGGSGLLQDLNTLVDPSSGWTLTKAYGINDRGQIVGYGTNPNGDGHGYILTPVPEPSTLALLGVVAVGLLAYRRSRRRGGDRVAARCISRERTPAPAGRTAGRWSSTPPLRSCRGIIFARAAE